MPNHKPKLCALTATLALLAFPLAHGADPSQAGNPGHVIGEKLDSGLGELPPYSEWARHPETRNLVAVYAPRQVIGEKLDSELGELPHYHEWTPVPDTGILANLQAPTSIANK